MTHMPHLFTPISIKDLTIKNRIWVSPMCQYSSKNGHPTDWHFVHLGARAVGGAGLVMVEATAVSPEGRITASDSGIWADEHISSFKHLVAFMKAQATTCAIQLAHAGRKGSDIVPWSHDQSTWQTLAPSPCAFAEGGLVPQAMQKQDIQKVIADFVAAAQRCLQAGFDIIELHFAHGYLMHQFLSPLSNQRTDEYGGSLENRMRLPLEIAKAVRAVWPDNFPLFARISATDWADGIDECQIGFKPKTSAWHLSDSIIFCEALKNVGVDLIDVSSGGTLPNAKIPVGPGYQTQFAQKIRHKCAIKTAAVGMITDPVQAEAILVQQQADAVFLAREFLRSPYWPHLAAKALGVDLSKPDPYARA